MEFILSDGCKISITKDENSEELVLELFDSEDNFLERTRVKKEDIYMNLF